MEKPPVFVISTGLGATKAIVYLTDFTRILEPTPALCRFAIILALTWFPNVFALFPCRGQTDTN